MGAPTILFDEFAALTALQQCITTAIPEVPQVDVYRARPSAAPSRWGLSVLLVPTTPLPVLTSYMGDQSTGTQQQLARFVFTTAAAGAWQARVLGQTSAAYVAGGGDTTTQIRNGVSAALALLGLPVTLTNTAAGVLGPGQAGLDVLADVAGPIRSMSTGLERSRLSWARPSSMTMRPASGPALNAITSVSPARPRVSTTRPRLASPAAGRNSTAVMIMGLGERAVSFAMRPQTAPW